MVVRCAVCGGEFVGTIARAVAASNTPHNTGHRFPEWCVGVAFRWPGSVIQLWFSLTGNQNTSIAHLALLRARCVNLPPPCT